MSKQTMRNFPLLLIILFLANQNALSQSDFQGVGGVFYKGTTGVPIKSSVYDLETINGIAVLFKWEDVEPTPGDFDWSYVDNEIAKAVNSNKKISLLPIGTPNWMVDLDVQTYYYLDENPYHPTYGEILCGTIPWDSTYVERYRNFLENLANKYANDTTVCYVNTVAGPFSRGMPDSVVIDTVTIKRVAFYDAFDYNADTLVSIEIEMIDLYMDLFPHTPLWFSVDYIKFEPFASGRDRNYLAKLCLEHGIENYPHRFGLFREDIQPCNPKLDNLIEGSHWYLMIQNPCRTGGQMLWSVQDGPTRMNKCSITPNTKQVVFDSAINMALTIGMRYAEIYGTDISDTSLTSNIKRANQMLKAISDSCAPIPETPVYNLTVNNGTGDGTYQEGEEVNIMASIPHGQEFLFWTGDNQYLTDTTTPTAIFNMPDRNISLTAVYKDKISRIEQEVYGLMLYPNPAQNTVTITANHTISTLIVTDIIGKTIVNLDVQKTKTKLNVSAFPAGVYFFNIGFYDKTKSTSKVIVQ